MKNIGKALALGAIGMAAAAMPAQGDACTRVIYEGADSLYIIGRSLDWKTPIPTNLYVYHFYDVFCACFVVVSVIVYLDTCADAFCGGDDGGGYMKTSES